MIDAILRAKCCCVVFSNSFVDSVVWRTDCPTLVVQASLLSVVQAEFPPVSVYTDPMQCQRNQYHWTQLGSAQHFPYPVSDLAILGTPPKLQL